MRKQVELFLIALSSPIQIGIYEDSNLIEVISSDEKSSDVLPLIFDKLLEKYDVKSLFYLNGPGSFMAIKVAYVFLKSISIIKNIPLFATDAFKFNQNTPIKAIGKLYFVNISNEIITKKLDTVEDSVFELPKILNQSEFDQESAPLYSIGAVG
jgi:tRNA A37 threonylcarbamoyladenosine modification protein TsaB